MDVYIDLYFFINSGMDFICLLITAILLRREMHTKRGIFASIIGGIWACFSLLVGMQGLLSVLFDILIGCIICTVAFYEKGNKPIRLLRDSGIFLVNSMLLGGIMTVLFTFLNRLKLPFDLMEDDDLPIWLFSIVGAASGLITLLGAKMKRKNEKNKIVKMTVTLFGQKIRFNALVDSGNLLEDPISGKSVISVEWKKISFLFPDIRQEKGKPLYQSLCEEERWKKKIRLIPAQTAAGSQLLPAIQPDHIQIEDRGETVSVNALLALTDLPNSSDDIDAIIAPIT